MPSNSRRSDFNLESLLTTLLWALFFARWFVPTEGSPEGETLWLSALTLAVSAFWFWWQSKQGVPRLSPGLLDAAIWSVAGAHVVSAVLVIAGEGEKRLALNMLWEWFSLAALVTTLRQMLLKEAARERFRQTVVIVGVSLAVFGIWQHYFWYGNNLKEYQILRSELEDLETTASLTPEQARRKLELESRFLSDNIPLREPQRGLFERRLRDSSEPLGFFALANSFAGILAVVTVLLAAGLLQQFLANIPARPRNDLSKTPDARASPNSTRTQTWLKENSVQLGCLVVATFTLLLTKSRTAFVGAAAGLVLAVLLSLAGLKREALKRAAVITVFAALLSTVLVGVGVATGSLDIEVLSEAPKSLEYRMLYWRGTAQVIAESPWFGVGPGNFRSHYLRHKLPETSEEISDPHNFVLDVVANAGVPGALTLLFLLVVILRNAIRLAKSPWQPSNDGDAGSESGQPLDEAASDVPSPTTVVCVAAGVAVGWQFVAEASTNLRVLSTGILAIVICIASGRIRFTSRAVPGARLSPVACVAAIFALLVHLLAAGGIAMPAICGCLLILTVLAEPLPTRQSTRESAAGVRATVLGLAIAMAVAFGACLQTAFLPLVRSTAQLRSGDFEATRQSRFDLARKYYSDAAAANPLSPEPLMRLSDVLFLLWEQTRRNEHFGEGVKFALEAAKRNPYSGYYAYQIGRRHRQLFKQTNDHAAAESAVEWLGKAVAAYPTHPLWNAEFAVSLDEAGRTREATMAATSTLRLDAINRKAGHVDKYLPDPILKEVRRIAGVDSLE